ncbi:putative nuclease HARBI1 [Ylistrum balloti]|uniref:putative nuclease HARBI1 n=1 Tax=Ylistrum balloti TaxID=509963 RepID=UPI002905D489|nr:putative nuclease HARBI1 [Ylistrum balloti]
MAAHNTRNTLLAAAMLLQDDDSDSNDESMETISPFICIWASLLQGDEKARIRNYVENVVPLYTDTDFRRMFRMNLSTYKALINYLQDLPGLQPAGPGRRDAIPLNSQILLTLWYLGGVDTIAKIADRFGMSDSSVVLCRDRVLSAIVNLRHKLIVWPSRQEMVEEADIFSKRNGFPGIVGAIDGTHIKIRAPSLHPQSYVNRKGYHSLQLQCVCHHNMFSDVFTGYPGSCHDARALKNSDLWSKGLMRCNMVYHGLGDGTYPLRRWLLTPYRDNGHLTQGEKKYNFYHSGNRVVIERAFALLKSRFRRIHHIDSPKVSTVVDIIMASCVLHNICIKQNDNIDEFLSQDGAAINVNLIQDHNTEGMLKRNNITRNLV